MNDTRTDDELRAAVADGERAQAELAARAERKESVVRDRITRVLSGDAAAPFGADELRFAAFERCWCGAGFAYPIDCGTKGAWHCSAILRGIASRERVHSEPLPFAFYSVKAEGQPSANGATTRDAGVIS